MDITLTLTDAEVAALQSEMQSSEDATAVIRRLIAPLVGRAVKQHFDILSKRFDTLPVERQAQVITQLEQLFKS